VARRRQPQQTRSRQRQQLILESTRQILREQGVAAVSTTSIAARAAIPVGSVYQYFPDKTAILAALYEEYLGGIRSVYDRFEDPEILALGWREVVRRLLKELLELEEEDQTTVEFEKALKLFPELAAVDRQHRVATAERLAGLLRKLGSRWQMRRLKRLVQFVYAMNSGVWGYRNEFRPPKGELLAWQLRVYEDVFSQCFE
jgi:AcrR family transcriptional regulator